MHPALEAVKAATFGTPFEGQLWLVGGAVRDELLQRAVGNDFDVVLTGSSAELAQLLFEKGTSHAPPVEYARFGTAMVQVQGLTIEIATARKESYSANSRKPLVEPATLEEDAMRRDFTVNTLLVNLHSGQVKDPLGKGLADLKARILRTPLNPVATFYDDPLRMLRAVRFRWQLGFEPAPGLYEGIAKEAHRLKIISAERIRDELVKMLKLVDAHRCMKDLLDLHLLHEFAPEFEAMVGVEQGNFHHLDVWDHTLLVLKNAGQGDVDLSLAALLHDIAKPATRTVDKDGRTRFFSHETVGARMSKEILKRLRFSSETIEAVAKLVKNHMRLGTAGKFSDSAARRVVRDMGDLLEPLLKLVEADSSALKPGVKQVDVEGIRARLAQVLEETPRETLESPLSGEEIMALTGLEAGPKIGKLKEMLVEAVLDGRLRPEDREGARRLVREAPV